jgi:hypothetical protein
MTLDEFNASLNKSFIHHLTDDDGWDVDVTYWFEPKRVGTDGLIRSLNIFTDQNVSFSFAVNEGDTVERIISFAEIVIEEAYEDGEI